MIYPLNLQLHAEGGTGNGGAGMGAGTTGVTPQNPAAGNTGVMGANPGHQGNQPTQQPAQQDSAAAWQEAKTKYKAQYDADVQRIVQGRLKDAAGHQQTLAALKPMLDAMATQMGVKAGDYQAMVAKYMDNDDLYEKEALDRGSSVETVKELYQVRNERDHLKQQVDQYNERLAFDRHMQGLMQQAESLKSKYPQLDLNAMVNDERFWRMAGPGGPLNLEQAYVAMYHDQLQAQAMQAAATQSQRMAAQNVQANMARPRENAGKASGPQANMTPNFSNLTLKQIQENSRLARMGQRVVPQ